MVHTFLRRTAVHGMMRVTLRWHAARVGGVREEESRARWPRPASADGSDPNEARRARDGGPGRRPARAHPRPRRRHRHAAAGPRRSSEAGLPRRALRAITRATSRAPTTCSALTQPDVVREMHAQYLEAGADIITTNTFNATRPSHGRLRRWSRGSRRSTARPPAWPARHAMTRRGGRRHDRATCWARWARPTAPPRSRPTSTTPARATSPSRSWPRPTSRPLERWSRVAPTPRHRDHLRHAQRQGRHLRGRDARGTSWATGCRSSSAAPSPTPRAARSTARRWPPSGTPCAMRGPSRSASTARSAATSCGPTPRSSAGLADTFLSLYPNAGLPNAFGGYDETPEHTSSVLGGMAARRRGQHRRRLLWHRPRPRPRHHRPRSPAWRRASSPRSSRAPAWPASSPRHRPGLALRQHRRAHQRHRLAQVRAAHPRRRTTTRPWRSPASRSRTAPRSSTSTWTRACSTRRRP